MIRGHDKSGHLCGCYALLAEGHRVHFVGFVDQYLGNGYFSLANVTHDDAFKKLKTCSQLVHISDMTVTREKWADNFDGGGEVAGPQWFFFDSQAGMKEFAEMRAASAPKNKFVRPKAAAPNTPPPPKPKR